MGRMLNRNACRGKLILFLVALVVLAAPPPSAGQPEDIEQTQDAAEQGDPEAQARLADMDYSGEEVPQDYQEAAKWCRLAADQSVCPAVRLQAGEPKSPH